jgi:glycosyltransferase involved in cell wall biosynthesis
MAHDTPRRLTVFTPTYNRRHTLPRLYASLCAQQDADFEWLIIDDGSTDGTRDWVSEVAATAPLPICYHHQANAGKQAAWNRALDLAHGNYFCGIDSDDAIRPGALAEALALCDRVLANDDALIGVRFASQPVPPPAPARTPPTAVLHGRHSYFDELAAGAGEERVDIFVTGRVRPFRFPVEADVKFIPEVWYYVTIAARGYAFYYTPLVLGAYYADHRQLSRTRLAAHARGHFASRSAMLRHVPLWVWRRQPAALAKTLVRWLQAGFLVLIARPRPVRPRGSPRP